MNKILTESIFTSMGTVRTDLDKKDIAALSKVQRDILMVVLDTSVKSAEAEATASATEKAWRVAMREHDDRMKDHARIVPKWTAHDEWRRTVARLPTPPTPPELQAKIDAAVQAVEDAHALIGQRNAENITAKKARDEARKNFGNAVREWSKVDERPRTVGDLVKERAKAEQKAALQNIADGYGPEGAVSAAHNPGPNHIDHFMSGSGGRDQVHAHSVNRGYNRNKMRGAQLAPKLPSER
jgi:hypothetical protein